MIRIYGEARFHSDLKLKHDMNQIVYISMYIETISKMNMCGLPTLYDQKDNSCLGVKSMYVAVISFKHVYRREVRQHGIMNIYFH